MRQRWKAEPHPFIDERPSGPPEGIRHLSHDKGNHFWECERERWSMDTWQGVYVRAGSGIWPIWAFFPTSKKRTWIVSNTTYNGYIWKLFMVFQIPPWQNYFPGYEPCGTPNWECVSPVGWIGFSVLDLEQWFCSAVFVLSSWRRKIMSKKFSASS